jgi:hypothetical protein
LDSLFLVLGFMARNKGRFVIVANEDANPSSSLFPAGLSSCPLSSCPDRAENVKVSPVTGETTQRPSVLVTRAAGTLGTAIAMAFAEAGHFVGIHFRSSRGAAESLLESVRSLGADGVLLEGDLARPGDAERLIATFSAASPRLDVLVNNAGLSRDEIFYYVKSSLPRWPAFSRHSASGSRRLRVSAAWARQRRSRPSSVSSHRRERPSSRGR